MSVEAPIAPAVSAPAASPAPAAAPAAAPSAPPPPAPAPAADAPPPGGTVQDAFDKQFADLEEAPAVPPAGTKPPESDTKPPVEGTKPPATATKPPEGATKPGEESFDVPQSGSLIQVRNWGRRMADMAKSATTKLKELNAQVEELRNAKPALPPDVEKIQADYQRLQTELQEHRTRLAQSDYSKSPEYEEQFRQPYQQSYVRGRQAVQNLLVRERNPETGEVTTRPGTADDFDKLYHMTDSEADEAAEAMFGPSARRVITLRDAAKEKAEAAFNAVKEHSAKYAEQKKHQEATTSQQRLAMQGLWSKVNGDLQTKHEKWFGEHEGDTAWNEALTKGRQIAIQRFSDAYAKLAPEQKVVLDAQVFNRAAAFAPLKVLVTRLETELADANKTIEQLRGSGPGKPGAGGGGEGAEPKDWETAFEKKV